jgi:hypothetical protein
VAIEEAARFSLEKGDESDETHAVATGASLVHARLRIGRSCSAALAAAPRGAAATYLTVILEVMEG